MKIFLDTEFNGHGGQLLSIGMAADDGATFYQTLKISQAITPWVVEHVLLKLGKPPLEKNELQYRLQRYLNRSESIHIIADWPDDIKYFCELLITGPGERLDTPPLTMEIRRDIDSSKSLIPHHALADAKALRGAYYRLQQAGTT